MSDQGNCESGAPLVDAGGFAFNRRIGYLARPDEIPGILEAHFHDVLGGMDKDMVDLVSLIAAADCAQDSSATDILHRAPPDGEGGDARYEYVLGKGKVSLQLSGKRVAAFTVMAKCVKACISSGKLVANFAAPIPQGGPLDALGPALDVKDAVGEVIKLVKESVKFFTGEARCVLYEVAKQTGNRAKAPFCKLQAAQPFLKDNHCHNEGVIDCTWLQEGACLFKNKVQGERGRLAGNGGEDAREAGEGFFGDSFERAFQNLLDEGAICKSKREKGVYYER